MRFYVPRLQQVDPPAGEGFYLAPPTAKGRGPTPEDTKRGVLVIIEWRLNASKEWGQIAKFLPPQAPVHFVNTWGEGEFRASYRMGKTRLSGYSKTQVMWPASKRTAVEN